MAHVFSAGLQLDTTQQATAARLSASPASCYSTGIPTSVYSGKTVEELRDWSADVEHWTHRLCSCPVSDTNITEQPANIWLPFTGCTAWTGAYPAAWSLSSQGRKRWSSAAALLPFGPKWWYRDETGRHNVTALRIQHTSVESPAPGTNSGRGGPFRQPLQRRICLAGESCALSPLRQYLQ
jgi:hypothetical protein